VRNAQRAEQAGFDFAAISDHFSPWLEEQGHSPLAWSVLGAIGDATERIGLMTAVTCPIMRYHPAIIAQGAATLGLLSDNRFTLGLGAGAPERHVVGAGWPGRGERHERLSEAIDIIQGLLAGDLTYYRGRYFRLDHARLFDRPAAKPAVVIAAGGTEAARLAGRKGDGLIVTEPRPDLIEAFASAGASGPRYAEVALCLRRARGGRPQDRASLLPLVGHRLARSGRTPRYRRLRGGDGARDARDGGPDGDLRPVAGAPSRGDRPLRPGRLRPHHPGPGRPRPGRLLRSFRARARPRPA
jgi:G6PDH family F420-dependent oxidoreductase